MLGSTWWVAGLAVPAVLVKSLLSSGRSQPVKAELPSARPEEGNDPMFTCERVCTSTRLLRRMGGLAKDPTPNTCVTVCGVSGMDACEDACQRAVCTNMHQVPAWNDACLRKCTSECARGRAA